MGKKGEGAVLADTLELRFRRAGAAYPRFSKPKHKELVPLTVIFLQLLGQGQMRLSIQVKQFAKVNSFTEVEDTFEAFYSLHSQFSAVPFLPLPIVLRIGHFSRGPMHLLDL